MMRRFREHRALLEEALETTFTFKSIAALETHIRRLGALNHEPIATITAEFYGRRGDSGDDARIGWKNVHLVMVNGIPFGWMEGPWTDAWVPRIGDAAKETENDRAKPAPGDVMLTADEQRRGDGVFGGNYDGW